MHASDSSEWHQNSLEDHGLLLSGSRVLPLSNVSERLGLKDNDLKDNDLRYNIGPTD